MWYITLYLCPWLALGRGKQRLMPTCLGASSSIVEEVTGRSKEVNVERLVDQLNVLVGEELFTTESVYDFRQKTISHSIDIQAS